MPVDARIALMGQGVKIDDPTERRLKTAHAQFYEGEAMREQAKAKTENDTNEALKKFGSDITPDTIKGMMGVNPRVAQQMQGMLSKRQADAVALQKSQFDSQESEIKYQKARVDSEAAKLSHNAQIFSTVKTPEQRLMAAQKAFQLGSMTEAEARHVLDQPFDEFTKEQEQLVNMGQTIAQRATAEHAQLDEQRKKINEDRKALLFPDKLAKSKSDAQVAANSAEAGKVDPKTGMTRYQAQQAKTAEGNVNLPELLMRAAQGDKGAMAALQLHKTYMTSGKDGGSSNSGLVDQIMANPNMYNDLTPTAKTAVMKELSAKGFEFGKPLSESAITKLSESKSAIASLQDLRQTLKDNEQYLGPVSGFQALNPYSDARKAQAKIDLVRQRVGKTLEGGVLRKEDEEKYKKILATLNDTPSTALSKIDGLAQSIERDMKTFEEEQRRAGRRVNTGAKKEGDSKKDSLGIR